MCYNVEKQKGFGWMKQKRDIFVSKETMNKFNNTEFGRKYSKNLYASVAAFLICAITMTAGMFVLKMCCFNFFI